jgi:hypothetical protein
MSSCRRFTEVLGTRYSLIPSFATFPPPPAAAARLCERRQSLYSAPRRLLPRRHLAQKQAGTRRTEGRGGKGPERRSFSSQGLTLTWRFKLLLSRLLDTEKTARAEIPPLLPTPLARLAPLACRSRLSPSLSFPLPSFDLYLCHTPSSTLHHTHHNHFKRCRVPTSRSPRLRARTTTTTSSLSRRLTAHPLTAPNGTADRSSTIRRRSRSGRGWVLTLNRSRGRREQQRAFSSLSCPHPPPPSFLYFLKSPTDSPLALQRSRRPRRSRPSSRQRQPDAPTDDEAPSPSNDCCRWEYWNGSVHRYVVTFPLSLTSVVETDVFSIFAGSGQALRNGGPLGILIAWLIIGVMLINVTQALGELCILYPVSGGFYTLAVRFLDPSFGMALGWSTFYSSPSLYGLSC